MELMAAAKMTAATIAATKKAKSAMRMVIPLSSPNLCCKRLIKPVVLCIYLPVYWIRHSKVASS